MAYAVPSDAGLAALANLGLPLIDTASAVFMVLRLAVGLRARAGARARVEKLRDVVRSLEEERTALRMCVAAAGISEESVAAKVHAMRFASFCELHPLQTSVSLSKVYANPDILVTLGGLDRRRGDAGGGWSSAKGGELGVDPPGQVRSYTGPHTTPSAW